MKEICVGCGAQIQTTDSNQKGYIDEEVYLKRKSDFYCKRCFSLRHYNKNIEYQIDSQKYLENLELIKKDRGLIVNIVDLFDLEGTIIPDINKIFDTDNILFVLNKVDLFLDSININKIENYIFKYLKDKKIKVLELVSMSSFNNDDITYLIDAIKEFKQDKNVYFVGMTNVGKSSIINKIIGQLKNSDDLITVSNTMNTTLDNIYIPYDRKTFLVDTPGIINKKNLMNFLDKASMEEITPKSYVRPKTFQLSPEQTLFVLGVVRVDFISGIKSSFVTNFRNDLLVHRTKLANADDFYHDHLDDILKIPNSQERDRLGDKKVIDVKFNEEEKIDIVISGLGFISVLGVGQLKVSTFKNVHITIRKAIL
jgi:ribosome biogenesis GTPase YqeH